MSHGLYSTPLTTRELGENHALALLLLTVPPPALLTLPARRRGRTACGADLQSQNNPPTARPRWSLRRCSVGLARLAVVLSVMNPAQPVMGGSEGLCLAR